MNDSLPKGVKSTIERIKTNKGSVIIMNYIVTTKIMVYGLYATIEEAMQKINYLTSMGIPARVGKIA